MKLKSVFLSLLVGSLTFSSLAAPLVTVSKKQFGADKWPFSREEVMLECRANGAMVVINPSTLMQYPLNDIALEQMKSRQINAMPIDVLLLDDPKQAGTKMSILPVKEATEQLCQ